MRRALPERPGFSPGARQRIWSSRSRRDRLTTRSYELFLQRRRVMLDRNPEQAPQRQTATPSRRGFLRRASTVAAGAGVIAQPGDAAQPAAAQALPTVALGPHQVSRLIIGGNPIYGYSHFN